MGRAQLKDYKCIFCYKNCVKKSRLFRHYLVHIGENPVNCELCGAAFRCNAALKSHMSTHLRIISKEKKPSQCNMCKMTYTRRDYFMKHRCPQNNQIKCTKERKLMQCNICEKFIKGTIELGRHIRSHTGERPYRCIVCQKQFRRKGTLKVHQLTHDSNPVKSFVCEHCGASFVRKDVLKAHMVVHAGVKPYQCDICGKSCSQLSGLRVHQRTVHQLERDHECELCGKRFGTRGELVSHVRIHTGERPFKCEKCLKSFAHHSALGLHRRAHICEIN